MCLPPYSPLEKLLSLLSRQVKLEDLLLSYLVGREVKPTLLRLLSLLMKLALLLASTCELE